ncbi:MAG: RNA polymerase factor sigma-54 [Flammeovirgaceae bacterium]
MNKPNLSQSLQLQQKLSPQQIQFIKLLQIPVAELEARIQEELTENPLLEEVTSNDFEENYSINDLNNNDSLGNQEDNFDNIQKEEYENPSDNKEFDDYEELEDNFDKKDEISFEDYIQPDDVAGYKMYGDGNYEEEDREMPLASSKSLTESLLEQLGFVPLSEKSMIIGKQIIGSIDEDGYMKRDLEAIANDLAFSQNIIVSEKEVEKILKLIQTFDPPGIAARNLQECLELQIKRKDIKKPMVHNALKIVSLCFEEFTKKHYSKIQKRLDISDQEIKEAVALIEKLNPKPGGISEEVIKTQYLMPDFILKEVNGRLEVTLNSKNAPELRISRQYAEMIDTYDKAKKKDKKLREAASFLKQKLDSAKWFIDAIKQRQETLLKTMNAIVEHQKEFFLTGDESKLKPMILKNIADAIQMDISTVSRVANSKAVQTDFGIFPLKFFFSESITTEEGEEVSSKEVKYHLKQMIDNEDKSKPLSDEKLEQLLNIKGYNIARRTVAKYREQLGIPVARLRKEL